jgi:hypothetical protein
VTARARAVGAHVALYVDTLAPPNGMSQADVDSLEAVLDTRLYAIDTTNFGGVTDIDNNGVVITLMTGVVNSLVTNADCQSTGFVEGFFDPDDLNALSPSSNHGEIYYSIVPDPSGTLSCAHTVSQVKADMPPTFMHEFEHMINFAQHVLMRGGNQEDTWLDEGLAKLAEELGGESYLPADRATFTNYVIGDLYDAYQYLLSPADHFLVTNTDTVLPDVGAGWLFVRYLVDQFGSGIAQKLVQTTHTGSDNIAIQTGQPFATSVARWGLANWVSDLPGFTAATRLRYTSWSFRSVYQSFHTQDPQDFPLAFPLTPVAGLGGQIATSGILRAGSAAYVSARQGPKGAAFALRLRSSATQPLPSRIAGRFTVIRIR